MCINYIMSLIFFQKRFVNAYIYCIEIAVQVSDVAYETLVYVNSVDILKLAFLVNRQEVGC